MFDTATVFFAYFPRTIPSGKSDGLYSLRSVSFRWLAFFINFSFSGRARPRADDANSIAPIRVRYHQ